MLKVCTSVSALSCMLAYASSALAQSVIGGCPVFPADNIWNTPVESLPVHASSSSYVSMIGPASGLKFDFGSGTWEGGPIGVPFIVVPGTQTKYPAYFTYARESDPGPYAIPMSAPIEGGPNSTSDRHAISIDRDGCKAYEMHRAFPQTTTWKADAGAIYDLRSNALRPAGWTSADAAGMPMFAGLTRYDEVAAGEIRHALRFTVPRTHASYVWPARHEASSITDTRYPPMGTRFRLKASFDTSPYPSDVQVILRALKKYGMIVADHGSAWYVSGAPDSRWNNANLNTVRNIVGSNFEAVNVSSLLIDPNSGQARQSTIALSISPLSTPVLTQGTVQFSAVVTGTTNKAVAWSVNGIAGGNSQVGYIDTAGRYSAPSSVPVPSTVTVRATSIAQPSAAAVASVSISVPAAPLPPAAPPSAVITVVASADLSISTLYGGNGVTFRGVKNPLMVNSSGNHYRALLRFGNIAIPAGHRITSAIVTIGVQTWATGQIFSAYPLASTWDMSATTGWLTRSGTLPWATAGAGTADRSSTTPFIFGAVRAVGDQLVQATLPPALVQNWIQNPASNKGLVIINTAVGQSASIYSYQSTTAGLRPTLKITTAE